MTWAWPSAIERWLVCLDLEEGVGQLSPPVAAGCRRALALARVREWRVMHLYRRVRGARPLPGLAPLPSEAVLERPGLSAFSSAAFRDRVRAERATSLVIIGADMAGAALATALAAADFGAQAVLLRDAFPDPSALQAVSAVLAVRAESASVESLASLELDTPRHLEAANQP